MAVQIVPVDDRVTRDVRFRDIPQVSGPSVCMLYLPIRATVMHVPNFVVPRSRLCMLILVLTMLVVKTAYLKSLSAAWAT